MAKQTTTPSSPAVHIARPEGVQPADRLLAEAERCAVITTREEAERSGLFLRQVRMGIRGVKAAYKRVRAPYEVARKASLAEEKADLAALKQADALVAPALLVWQVQEEERGKQLAQQALVTATDAARAEQQRRADSIRAAAQAAPTAKDRKALIQQAEAVAKAPLRPLITMPAVVPTKLEGISVGGEWVAEVQDLIVLAAAVVAGTVSVNAIAPGQDWLDGQARALQQDLSIPGVVATCRKKLSARGL